MAQEVRGVIRCPSANFTRPADTTAYASADLVANSTAAGSVIPLEYDVGTPVNGRGGMIRRVRLRKSGTSTTNAAFRIHFYKAKPTIANGDNSAWSTNGATDYLGAVDVTMDRAFTDGAVGSGVPNTGAEINFYLDDVNRNALYALIEARATYTPASGEVFTVVPEIHLY